MRRLVIFDLDGTLLNTLSDLADACNFALRSAGFPSHPEEAYKLFVGNGVRRLVERALPPGAGTADYERVFALFAARYEAHREDRTAPYPGIPALLRALRNRGMRVAVLSNKPHLHTVPMVEHYFPGLVDLAFGAREGVPIKPDPAAALEILDHFGIPAGEAAYVGDSGVDMETGRAAGLYTVGVTWGFQTKEELLERGAMAIVDKSAELEDILVDNG